MQAWIVKHKREVGKFLHAMDSGGTHAFLFPFVYPHQEAAAATVNEAKRPDDWRVVEVEITEK